MDARVIDLSRELAIQSKQDLPGRILMFAIGLGLLLVLEFAPAGGLPAVIAALFSGMWSRRFAAGFALVFVLFLAIILFYISIVRDGRGASKLILSDNGAEFYYTPKRSYRFPWTGQRARLRITYMTDSDSSSYFSALAVVYTPLAWPTVSLSRASLLELLQAAEHRGLRVTKRESRFWRAMGEPQTTIFVDSAVSGG